MFMKHYAPNRCEPSIEALTFGGRGGGRGRCERRCEVFVKILFGGRVGGDQVGGGGVKMDGSGLKATAVPRLPFRHQYSNIYYLCIF